LGLDEGITSGYAEGFILGRDEAPKLGADLGLILAQCFLLSHQDLPRTDAWKKIERLVKSIAEFPMENGEVDRDAMLSKIRAKYREACQNFPSLKALPDSNKPLDF